MIASENHPIHPEYGSCDHLGPGGVCHECTKIVNSLRKENEKLKELNERLSHYSEIAVERKSEIRKLKDKIANLVKRLNQSG